MEQVPFNGWSAQRKPSHKCSPRPGELRVPGKQGSGTGLWLQGRRAHQRGEVGCLV